MIKTPIHGQGGCGGPGRPVIQKLQSMLTSVSSSPGIIEHRDQPHSPIRYFTQEDINQGKILYRPPAAASHLQEIMAYSFVGNAFFLCLIEAPKSSLIFMASPASLLKNLCTVCWHSFLPIQSNLGPIGLYMTWAQVCLLFITSSCHRHTFSQLLFSGSGWGIGDRVGGKKSHWACCWSD